MLSILLLITPDIVSILLLISFDDHYNWRARVTQRTRFIVEHIL
jgi:hypothetical protein